MRNGLTLVTGAALTAMAATLVIIAVQPHAALLSLCGALSGAVGAFLGTATRTMPPETQFRDLEKDIDDLQEWTRNWIGVFDARQRETAQKVAAAEWFSEEETAKDTEEVTA